MSVSVSSLLERRTIDDGGGPIRRFVLAALGLHAAVALVAWFGPVLLAEPPQPIEYVAVRIIPAARLGIEQPTPRPPAPRPEPSKPAPPPASQPEPKIESKAPTLPTKRPEPRREEPQPAPRAESAERPTDAVPGPVEPQGIAGGTAAGLALGAPTVMLDHPEFTYGYYVDQMLNLISRNWTRPLVGGGVEAWIHFEIERNGTIRNVRITRSSGINSFDLAALRAVQASTPLPPLPRAFRESTLGVNLIVR